MGAEPPQALTLILGRVRAGDEQARDELVALVYDELGRKFRPLVEVLEGIAARSAARSSPEGALRVYESWRRTGSDTLESVLVDTGLLPRGGGLPN